MDCERCFKMVRRFLVARFLVRYEADVQDLQQSTCLACLSRKYRERDCRLSWSTVVFGLTRSVCGHWRRVASREAETWWERDERLAVERVKSADYYRVHREEVLSKLRARRAMLKESA